MNVDQPEADVQIFRQTGRVLQGGSRELGRSMWNNDLKVREIRSRREVVSSRLVLNHAKRLAGGTLRSC